VQIADLIVDFVLGTEAPRAAESRRVLATLMFTDIVGSTSRASELGDKVWHELLRAHDATIRREIARFRGKEIKSLGDGFLVSFDGPGRAIRCAQAIMEAMIPLGIQVRAGLHTGEVERTNGDVLGIAVHLAARIMDTATAGEVVISRTVRDLVAGTGIEFEHAKEYSLKGIEEKWQLFKVRSAV
jgi:class 3 adenylate cyclase